ncbi:MAG: thioredoxin-disulfide reductase [Desulfobacterales bacterium]|jgi:thioredoxin reductase (NADPH)|nr:thioredoxin-disulfide reductase [Desulfobacterales bacterium]
MAHSEVYDLIIVGGGAGGLNAGIYAMRAALQTVLIEKGIPGGQITMTEEVENYLGFEHVTGADLAMKFSQHAQAYGLDVRSQEVVAVEPGLAHHTVILADQTRLKAYAVILGTGGSPKRLNVPGESELYGKGVSYCGVCDGFFFRNKTVVVVGGGDTAAEEALYLAKLTKQVYLVHRRDALRAGMILQERLKADCKIELVWNTVITRIQADAQGVTAVKLKDVNTGETRDLPTDGVFIFVGFSPNNTLVPAGTKMNAEGYVITNERCETNTPGIFAIGDLREKYARQIVLSAADGCTAALAAAHYVETKKAVDDTCQLSE